jgi:4-hydroxy-tetrahydrodipicolinate synthase
MKAMTVVGCYPINSRPTRYAVPENRQSCSASPSSGVGMSETDSLRGAYCPLVVPFSDGKIDFDGYGKLIERQIVEGTHGLLVNATSGEPTMLTVEERGQLSEFAIKTSRGRLPVCAATASESFEASATLIDRFDKAGADSILVVTPFYSAPPQRGAVSYFTKLGARTKRPFLIYHIPGRTGFTLTIDTLAAIKDHVPHFAGIKNTDTDLGLVTGALARLGRDFRVFAGLELPTLPMLSIGACGMMITASNVAPRMVSQLYEAFAKKDADAAIALNLKLYPLFRGVALETSPIPVKYMLKRLGLLRTNEHRTPLVPASPEVEKQLDKVLADIGLA